MLEGKGLNEVTFTSGAALASTDMYRAVKIDSSGTSDAEMQVEKCGAGDAGVGILTSYESEGYPVKVAIGGMVKALAGGTIAVGDYVKADANGALVVTTTDTDEVFGRAVSAAASGEHFLLQIALGRYAG